MRQKNKKEKKKEKAKNSVKIREENGVQKSE